MKLLRVNRFPKGQSVAEFLVIMAVLVPLLLALASFANLLSLSTDAVEAGRFAAWERTVYQPTDDFTSADIDERVRGNIQAYYLDKGYRDFGPGKDLVSAGIPSIVDRTVDGGRPVSLSMPNQPAISAGLASKDTRLYKSLANGLSGDNNSDEPSLAFESPRISIAVNENYSLLKLVRLDNYRQASYEKLDTPDDDIAGRSQFNVSSQAALIAGGWMPVNDQDLADVTSNAAFDGGALRTFENPLGGVLFGTTGLSGVGFREASLAIDSASTGLNGYSTAPQNGTSLLPSDLSSP